jgi:hypothetical protein
LRTLAAVFVPIILIFVCALIILLMPLPAPFPPPASKARNLVAAIATGVLGMGYLVGLVVYFVVGLSGSSRALDPALTPLGLTARGYMVFGRQYTGAIEGRQVEIRYTPAQNIKPAVYEVYIATNTGTRMALGRQRPLLDCRDCPPVEVSGVGLDGVQVFSQDPTRAQGLLADGSTRAILARLLAGPAELYVQPNRLWLRAHPRQIAEQQARGWLDDLLALANAIEAL